MRALLGWLRRLGGVFSGGRRYADISQELESHLLMHIDDNRRAGMSPEEARRHALVKLGGMEQVKEQYRDRRGLPALEDVMKDVRFAMRMLRRTPGFSLVVLLTLAIGIGANTVMFSVVNSLLLRSLPYRDPERLMFVQTADAEGRRSMATSPPDFYAYREKNQTLDHLDAFYTQPYNLTGGREPERLPTLIISSGFFRTLGIEPALGRGFASREEQWGSHRVAILSDGLWQRRFGADPAILGQRILLNGEPYEVVGVLPSTFSFLAIEAQLVVPMAFEAGDNLNSHSNYFLSMIGRLKPQVTREQASIDLNRISEAIIADQSVNEGTVIEVTPLRDVLVKDVRRAVLVMLAAVGLVLLIACANLANLLLARASVRQREIAVRLAIGATRARLLRQFLVESLVLCCAGGALGLGLAHVSMDALNLLSQRVLPRAEDVRIDPVVLTFTFAVAMVAGILLGLAPASHTASADVNDGLKESARPASDTAPRRRLQTGLVVAQVALSLMLLCGAGLMVKSLYQLLHVDSGFAADGVLTLQVNLPPQKYVDRRLEREFSPLAYTRSIRFFTDVIGRVRAVPGARAVGAINGLPLMGEIWSKRVTLFDRPLPNTVDDLSSIQYRVVAGDYFRALGIPMVSGRAFTDRDTQDAPKVVIVNREMARHHWKGQDPVGKVLSVNPPLQLLPASVIEEAKRAGIFSENYEPDRFTVVGVAEDVRYSSLSRSALPLVYAPYAQGSEGTTNMFLVVRTDGEPLSLAGAIREQIAHVDREQPVANLRTMRARVDASVAQERLQMNVLGAFAAMAVLLAAIGIYGVVSYSVTRRAREFGIRFALGAARQDVVGLVLRQALTTVSLGVVLGIAGALLTTRVIAALLFGVSATDPSVYAVIVVLLSATAWVAAYVPARRAARLDPVITLRSE
jgi:predicted permease